MAIRKINSRAIGADVIAAEDLAANSVTVAEISDGAVTAAKLNSTLDISGKTITLPDAATSDNDRSAFHAYSSSQTANTGIDTDVIFVNETFDQNSCYNTTNGRFTAPVNGIYFFSAGVRLNGQSANARVDITFIKNGNDTNHFGGHGTNDGNDMQGLANNVMKLDANDYVQVRVNQNSGSSTTINSSANSGGSGGTFFCGFLVQAL